MARKFKSFGSPLLQNTDDVIEFEIYGYTFRCKQGIQGRKLLEFISQSDSDEGGGSAAAMLAFLDSSIIPEHRETFKELTESDDIIIPMTTLGDITSWLIEIYSGNLQEEASARSSDGQRTTTSSSGDGQSATGSTSPVLTPAT